MERIECKHGGLKRQCLICELKAEGGRLKSENEGLRRDLLWLLEDVGIGQIGEIDIHDRATAIAVQGEASDAELLIAVHEAIDAVISEATDA
jgi:hypothetical protein